MKIDFKIKPETRYAISLAMKVVGFAFGVVWLIFFVLAGLTLYNAIVAYVPKTLPMSLLPTWFIITLVLASIWLSVKVFNIIGVWTSKKES